VFPILRGLFHHYREHFSEITSIPIAKICTALCNNLYENTLHGDYVLYYVAAYALSLAGGEEWRRVLNGDTSELPVALQPPKLNWTSDSEVAAIVELFVDGEAVAQDEESGIDSDLSVDYEPTPREASNERFLKSREKSQRLLNLRKRKEQAEAKALYVCVLLFLLFTLCVVQHQTRTEMNASLLSICHDIDEINFTDCTSELLLILWPKIFPKDNFSLYGDVSAIHDAFMGADSNAVPFGALRGSLSSIAFWKKISSSRSRADKLAAEFAARLLCAGITECVVERLFSHVKWLVGFRRHSLSESSLESLAMLTYADSKK
jgi:hypothetical protein